MDKNLSFKEDTLEIHKDLYRDTPVRYLGYTNEVGEAFRAIIGSKWVLASYGIATAYVLADTVDKSKRVYDEQKLSRNRSINTAYTTADTLIWQMLASVAIPGFTINRICAASNYVLKKQVKVPKDPRKIIVAGIGLATIPFIIHPIDKFVDILLDKTLRQFKPS